MCGILNARSRCQKRPSTRILLPFCPSVVCYCCAKKVAARVCRRARERDYIYYVRRVLVRGKTKVYICMYIKCETNFVVWGWRNGKQRIIVLSGSFTQIMSAVAASHVLVMRESHGLPGFDKVSPVVHMYLNVLLDLLKS